MKDDRMIAPRGSSPIVPFNRWLEAARCRIWAIALLYAPGLGCGILGLSFFLLWFSLMPHVAAWAGQHPKARVLLLNSYHQGFRWTDDLTGAVISTLTAGVQQVEFHIEYMDTKRHANEAAKAAFRQLLTVKFREQQPDIVILSDDDALNFVEEFHQDLFPGVPVVFCGINSVPSALQAPKELFTGIVETLDIKDNISLALQLFPGTREIVFLSDGTPTGLGTREMARETEPSCPGVRFTYLNGEVLGTEEMLDRLRKLRTGSIVLAPTWYKDAHGTIFDNIDIYPLIGTASPVPVFITSSANLGLGVFGGKVNSGATQGRYAAQQALRILSGQAIPHDMPVETGSRNTYMFDSRQLTRFGIAENALPPDSLVQHRPFSFYQTYRFLVWGLAIAFSLFTGMIVALLFNIHRLQETRSSLSRSEENLRITLDSIGDAVISTDTHGLVTRINPVAETLTGWAFAEAVGKQLAEIFPLIDATTRQPRPNPLDKILAAGATVALERNTLLLARNGAEYRIADSGAPIRNCEGQVIGMVLVFRDITEEFARETQRNQSRKLEVIGQLAGGVAHDFNNMLGGILGSAEIIAMHLSKESPLQRYITTIIKACENATGLTRKLLTFSRKNVVMVAPMDIHGALANALSLLEHSLDKSITIKRDFKATAPTIEGDSSLIENSIINLCVNAAQAMEGGGTLTLTTTNVLLDETFCQSSPFDIAPGPYVRIDIQDTGDGMDPELLDRIFEPFFTTKGVGKGTGLGLSAVYGTVKEHRGCIEVSSEVGAGTIFYLYFPSITGPGTITSQEDSAEKGSGYILIIDDEQVIRTTAASILEDLGYQVVLAKDGRQGLEMYAAQQDLIDLVLLDMIMPGMSGVTCFKEIRALNPQARILVSSGFTENESLEELHRAGMMGFVKKPYRLTELAHAVAQALR